MSNDTEKAFGVSPTNSYNVRLTVTMETFKDAVLKRIDHNRLQATKALMDAVKIEIILQKNTLTFEELSEITKYYYGF